MRDQPHPYHVMTTTVRFLFGATICLRILPAAGGALAQAPDADASDIFEGMPSVGIRTNSRGEAVLRLRPPVPDVPARRAGRWRLYAGVDNLGDDLILPQLGLPQPGRTIALGVAFERL